MKRNALMRSAGSIGITAVARSVMMVGKDAGDPSRRILASVKSNLGSPPASIRFHFVRDEGNTHARIQWDGVLETVTADSMLQSHPQTPSAQMLAEKFLRETLSTGPRPSRELEDLAQADIGIAIGAGTDVATEAANIVLMQSGPLDILNAIILSKATVGKMKQNLVWASVYKLSAIPFAAGAFYRWLSTTE